MKRWLPAVVAMRMPHWCLWMSILSSFHYNNVSSAAVSAAEVFPQYRWAVPCPSDPSLTGYVSLADLNAEMRRHSSELSPPLNRIPVQEFRYQLCPQSTFNASVPLFLPPSLLLYSPVIQCGSQGNSIDTCIIHDGESHILLMDPLEGSSDDTDTAATDTDVVRQSIVIQGIIFQGSTDISIAAFSVRTHAQFIDCHWKDIQGRAAIMMANAKPLTWPDVAQPTFVLQSPSQHNIFASRRRLVHYLPQDTSTTGHQYHHDHRQRQLTAGSSSDTITMQVSCLECSFQDSGKDEFILLDSYMKGAVFILMDSTIQSIGGAMVVNMIQGTLQVVDTSISHCSTTIATVRGQFQSMVDIYNSTFSQNQQAMATIAIVHKSHLQMNASQLEHNQVTGAPLVIVESSHAAIADSCWTMVDTTDTTTDSDDTNTTTTTPTTAAVLVDSTSSLQLERTTILSLSSSSSLSSNTGIGNTTSSTQELSATPALNCSAMIWNLDDTMACMDTNTCGGTCEPIPIQDQCTIPTNLPTWEEWMGQPTSQSSTSSSGAKYQPWESILLSFLSTMVLGTQFFY